MILIAKTNNKSRLAIEEKILTGFLEPAKRIVPRTMIKHIRHACSIRRYVIGSSRARSYWTDLKAVIQSRNISQEITAFTSIRVQEADTCSVWSLLETMSWQKISNTIPLTWQSKERTSLIPRMGTLACRVSSSQGEYRSPRHKQVIMT